ncbi:MAG: phosphoribosylformylglycinamidine synthase subunit PurQ, partial [Bdellovibrionales bacterium]|nr:phosphoribosylformylglycinamidine synthase subunit PurQ [Bdellovibrionales bacterium]
LTYHQDINGSYERIAGLTDTTGQILGLMPHPEAALESSLHPEGFQQDPHLPLKLFKNAVQFAQENL